MHIDTDDIGSVVSALYEMISGPAGPRDYSRRWDVFHKDARMTRTGLGADGKPWLKIMTPEEHGADTAPVFAAEDFFEVEILREIKQFGNIAQVWSVYEKRKTPNGAPYGRGINSIQLYRGERGWRVINMIWDNERAGLTVPGV